MDYPDCKDPFASYEFLSIYSCCSETAQVYGSMFSPEYETCVCLYIENEYGLYSDEYKTNYNCNADPLEYRDVMLADS